MAEQIVVTFDHREPAGPMLVGPFPDRDTAIQWVDSQALHSAAWNCTPIEPPDTPRAVSAQVVRGTGVGSGSAHIVVAYAQEHPGQTVLVAAPEERLKEMFAEVIALIDTDAAVPLHAVRHREGPAHIEMGNGSRILFREPRRDGKGVQGLWPSFVWANQLTRTGEIEIVESFNRSLTGGWWNHGRG